MQVLHILFALLFFAGAVASVGKWLNGQTPEPIYFLFIAAYLIVGDYGELTYAIKKGRGDKGYRHG